LAALGIPDEAAYVDAYCRRTGRAGIADWDYYLAFNMFRMAAILQGILARARQGNATSLEALATGQRAAPMARAGWRLGARTLARCPPEPTMNDDPSSLYSAWLALVPQALRGFAPGGAAAAPAADPTARDGAPAAVFPADQIAHAVEALQAMLTQL